MIKSKLNQECGKRLKECLEACSMTQKELADLTGYTQQYISYIAVGTKPMSITAAKLFAKHLKVREEYLLDEDDNKTIAEMNQKRHSLFDELEGVTNALIKLAGFNPICDFIENWKELGLDKTIYGPFSEGETPGMHVNVDKFYSKLRFSTEIQVPNGKRFYCDTEDFLLLRYEILEYVKFRMAQLESKYAWRCDDGTISLKCEGSEAYIYNSETENVAEIPEYLENSIWITHNDMCFPNSNALENLKKKQNINS